MFNKGGDAGQLRPFGARDGAVLHGLVSERQHEGQVETTDLAIARPQRVTQHGKVGGLRSVGWPSSKASARVSGYDIAPGDAVSSNVAVRENRSSSDTNAGRLRSR